MSYDIQGTSDVNLESYTGTKCIIKDSQLQGNRAYKIMVTGK